MPNTSCLSSVERASYDRSRSGGGERPSEVQVAGVDPPPGGEDDQHGADLEDQDHVQGATGAE
jgi:hypothetical protein